MPDRAPQPRESAYPPPDPKTSELRNHMKMSGNLSIEKIRDGRYQKNRRSQIFFTRCISPQVNNAKDRNQQNPEISHAVWYR